MVVLVLLVLELLLFVVILDVFSIICILGSGSFFLWFNFVERLRINNGLLFFECIIIWVDLKDC